MIERQLVCVLDNVVRRELTGGTGETFEYYIGMMSSDVAKQLTFAPVLEQTSRPIINEANVDGATGYQRPGSVTRMRGIAEHLRGNPLTLVSPVILSARDQWEYVPDANNSVLGTLNCFGTAAIIDGQHRLGAFILLYDADEDIRPIEFIVVLGLSLREEEDLFLEQHRGWRGVGGLLALTRLEPGDASTIGRSLTDLPQSPFYNRITLAFRRPNHLFTMSAVQENVRRTFAHGAFDDTTLDDKVEIMIEYWTRITDTFVDEWADAARPPAEREFKLCETTALIAFAHAAGDILGPAFNLPTQTMNWDQVQNSLNQLAEGRLDLRKDGLFSGLTGEVGGSKIHRQIQRIFAGGS